MNPIQAVRGASLRFWHDPGAGSWKEALMGFTPSALLIGLARNGFGLQLVPDVASGRIWILIATSVGALVLVFYTGSDADAWKTAAGLVRLLAVHLFFATGILAPQPHCGARVHAMGERGFKPRDLSDAERTRRIVVASEYRAHRSRLPSGFAGLGGRCSGVDVAGASNAREL